MGSPTMRRLLFVALPQVEGLLPALLSLTLCTRSETAANAADVLVQFGRDGHVMLSGEVVISCTLDFVVFSLHPGSLCARPGPRPGSRGPISLLHSAKTQHAR